jgi:hypothetical protein
MDLRSITKVLLKLVGLYFLVMVITAIPNILIAQRQDMMSAGGYISFGVWGIAGIAFLVFPGVIIDRVIRIQALDSGTGPNSGNLLVVGVRLLGCYYALGALYGLVYHWAINHVFNGSISPDMRPDESAAFLASIIQVVVGLLLWVFGDPVGVWLERRKVLH